jgi:Ca2+-binding RTX toxin-like protein
MEFLLLLIPLGLLAAAIGGGGGDDDGGPEEPPPNDDVIEGTTGPDQLEGNGDDNLIFGANGNDEIEGGEDEAGNSGFDIIAGEGGRDTLVAGDDGGILMGGGGNDSLYGGAGGDVLIGGAGNDSQVGGEETDELYAVSGFDTLEGGSGDDLIVGLDARGASGPTTVVSPVGDVIEEVLVNRFGPDVAEDTLDRVERSLLSSDGVAGADVLDGGEGADLIGGDLGDTITGGEGDDDFLVYLMETTPDPVLITDFDTATENLRLLVEGFQPGNLAVADGPDGAVVSVGGNPVAILFDVLAADLPADAIQLQAV